MDLNHVALTGTLARDPISPSVERAPVGIVAPCPLCGVRTVVARRRAGQDRVVLDLRPGLRCFQLVIHDGHATAAESMAYPEHEPLCRGMAPRQDKEARGDA